MRFFVFSCGVASGWERTQHGKVCIFDVHREITPCDINITKNSPHFLHHDCAVFFRTGSVLMNNHGWLSGLD